MAVAESGFKQNLISLNFVLDTQKQLVVDDSWGCTLYPRKGNPVPPLDRISCLGQRFQRQPLGDAIEVLIHYQMCVSVIPVPVSEGVL